MPRVEKKDLFKVGIKLNDDVVDFYKKKAEFYGISYSNYMSLILTKEYEKEKEKERDDFKIRYNKDDFSFEYEPIFNNIHVYKNNKYLDCLSYCYKNFIKDDFINFCNNYIKNLI